MHSFLSKLLLFELCPLNDTLTLTLTSTLHTAVPPERQKLMVKGGWSTAGFMGTLKDDFDFANIKVKEGAVVNLMGTEPKPNPNGRMEP